MADKKITDLTAHTAPIDADVLPIVDSATGTTKKSTVSTLKTLFWTTPIIVGALTAALIMGGTAVGSGVTYKSTSGAGTASGIAHQFVGGTNGATTALTILNNGKVGFGTVTAPTESIHTDGSIIGGQGFSMGYGLTNTSLGFGFGRSFTTGSIFDSGRYSYQFTRPGNADRLDMEVYNGGGTLITNRAFTIDSFGNIGLGIRNSSGGLLDVGQHTAGIGTVSNSAGGTTVTGVGTQFLNTFKVGDTITIGGQTVAITSVNSNTSLSTAAITSANSGATYTLTGGSRFTVFGNGNVGVGNSNPQFSFQVTRTDTTGNDTASPQIMVDNTATSTGGAAIIRARTGTGYSTYPEIWLQADTGSTGKTYLRVVSNHTLDIRTNDVLRQRVDKTGYIIYPTAPTSSANFGSINIGATTAFDGSTSGFFVGSASGTQFAINAVSGFAGNLIDVQTAGTSQFKVTNAGVATFVGSITSGGLVSNTLSASNSGIVMKLRGGASTGTITGVSIDPLAFSTITSGNHNTFEITANSNFAPTSGTGTFNAFKISSEINQTGGASGISRGIYINPTLTAAADFRAIEVSAGVIVTAASTTTMSGIRLPHGAAPTSPVNGDFWTTTSGAFMQINGVTKTVTLI